MVKTVNLTSKEIEYQLKGDWEIEREEYDWDSSNGNPNMPSGGLFGGARIGGYITDRETTVIPEYVEDVSNVRISFDEDLVEIDSYPENFYVVGVELERGIDCKAVRAFTIEHSEIEEYYPAHTSYVKETKSGEHIVEFVVKIDSTLTNPLKYSSVIVSYDLDPGEKERRIKNKEAKPGFDFLYTCNLKEDTEVPSPFITVYPPLNIEVVLNSFDEETVEFDSVREAEKWIGNWFEEKSGELQETAEELL